MEKKMNDLWGKIALKWRNNTRKKLILQEDDVIKNFEKTEHLKSLRESLASESSSGDDDFEI